MIKQIQVFQNSFSYSGPTLVSGWVQRFPNKLVANISSIATGILFLSLLAQLSIPLPWTPVPITGQTFGVLLLSLLWGNVRAPICMAGYLTIGALGAPVFSAGKSGLFWGPTIGYLAGMQVSSLVVGYLSEHGWGRSFWKAYFAGTLGSLIIFIFGLAVLSFFIPQESLLLAGFYPFLPGDFIKTITAALIASRANRSMKSYES